MSQYRYFQSYSDELHLSIAKEYFLRTFVRLPGILKQYKWMQQSEVTNLRIQCSTMLWIIWSITNIILFIALTLVIDLRVTIFSTLVGIVAGTLLVVLIVKCSTLVRLGLSVWEKLGNNVNALFSLIICYLLMHLIYSQSANYSPKFAIVGILPLVLLIGVAWFEATRICNKYEYLVLVGQLYTHFQTNSVLEMSGETVWNATNLEQKKQVSQCVSKLKESRESYKILSSLLIWVLLTTSLFITMYLVQ